MYKALWNLLPVPTILKVLIFLLLFVLLVVLCFTVIFPFIVNYIPYPFGNKGFE
jgi:predicted PurR-regulated permease PerM